MREAKVSIDLLWLAVSEILGYLLGVLCFSVETICGLQSEAIARSRAAQKDGVALLDYQGLGSR